MSEIISNIFEWANSKLQYWERLALYKIMAGEELTEQIYDDLLNQLLIDNGLRKSDSKKEDICFDEFVSGNEKEIYSPIHLCEIKNLENVNALVPKQSLPFGTELTIIYGANGSGKSGYSRVLGCAGFIRGEVDILPNINDPEFSTVTTRAEIVIKDDNSKKSIIYSPNQECKELNSLHVFDVNSVQEHLIKKNMFTFTPLSLTNLTKLAAVTDAVREKLTDLVEKQRLYEDYTPLFQDGDSAVKDIIIELSSQTDLNELKNISGLNPEEIKQLHELDNRIAELKIKSVTKQISELEKIKEDLNNLLQDLNDLSLNLNDNSVKNIKDNINKFIVAEEIAKKVGIEQFKTEFFKHTGTQIWYDFILSAKTLADAEQIEREPYPQEEDKCLLCHQTLSKEAMQLILKLWKFLESEAQSKSNDASENLTILMQSINEIQFDFFNNSMVSYRYIQEYDKSRDTNVIETVSNFIAGCKRRSENLLQMINNKDFKSTIFGLPESGQEKLNSIIKLIDEKLKELKDLDTTEEIRKLETELITLKHKKVLEENYTKIAKYILRLKWADLASHIGGSTRHITIKYNSLFEEIVTGGYLKLFQKILNQLKRPISVKVDTMPRKGITFRQLMLNTDTDTLPPVVNPDTVLSEGEKRAVALADFLTEVALDKGSAGIVLDDPVTSLDLEWSSAIASMLVKESKNRQVIIFTHNLPFVYYIKNFCQDNHVDVRMHWIKRGDTDNLPGYIFTDNSPALESDYKSTHIAKIHYEKAKGLPPEDQEQELKQGFGALRTTYESFIIYNLLAGVVVRFDERISPGRLKDVVWNKELFRKVIDKHEHLSKFIEGHLHSDAISTIRPSPEGLIKEIQEFEEIVKQYKELKKSMAS